MSLWIDDGLHKAEDGIRSFLLVGQSNMAGRGDLSKENALTAPDCFMLRMGRWQKMSEPINVDRAVTEGSCPRSGANLAASFAAQLQKETGAKIGLIPCADGGTRISQWQPGEVLFDHAVFQSRLAQRTSTLTAILWHQGESDCLAPERLEAYPEQFLRMMRASGMNWEICHCSRRTGLAGKRLSRHACRTSAHIQPPTPGMGDTAATVCCGIGRWTDRPTGRSALTTEALRTLGLRYLEAYKSLL